MKLFTKMLVGLTLVGCLVAGGAAMHRMGVASPQVATVVALPTGSVGSEVAGTTRSRMLPCPVGEPDQSTVVEPALPLSAQQQGRVKARQGRVKARQVPPTPATSAGGKHDTPPATATTAQVAPAQPTPAQPTLGQPRPAQPDSGNPVPGQATPALSLTRDVHGVAPAPGVSPSKPVRPGKPAPGMDFDRWNTPAQRAASDLFGVAVDAGLVLSGSGHADELAKVVRFRVAQVDGMTRRKQQQALETLVADQIPQHDALAGYSLDVRIGPEHAACPAVDDPRNAATSTVAPRPAQTP